MLFQMLKGLLRGFHYGNLGAALKEPYDFICLLLVLPEV